MHKRGFLFVLIVRGISTHDEGLAWRMHAWRSLAMVHTYINRAVLGTTAGVLIDMN